MLNGEVMLSRDDIKQPLGTTADSPLEYLYDLLYAEPGMPEGCVAQVMGCAEEHKDELKTLLM